EVIEEIVEAKIAPDEDQALKQELQRLTHAEHLAQLANAACDLLNDGEHPVIAKLADVRQVLAEAAGIDPGLAQTANQVAPVLYQLDDLHRTLRSYAARTEADPARLEWINGRLATIERLTRKHGGSVAALVARGQAAEAELAELDQMDTEVER